MAPRSVFASISPDLAHDGPDVVKKVLRFDGDTFKQLRERLQQAHLASADAFIEVDIDGTFVNLLDDEDCPAGDLHVRICTIPSVHKPVPWDAELEGSPAFAFEPYVYGFPEPPPHHHGHHGPPHHGPPHGSPPHHGPGPHGPGPHGPGFGPPPRPVPGHEAEASDWESRRCGRHGGHRHRRGRHHSRGHSKGRSKSRSLSPGCRRKPHHHPHGRLPYHPHMIVGRSHGPVGRLLRGHGPCAWAGMPWMRGPPPHWWRHGPGAAHPEGPPEAARSASQEEVAAAIAALSVDSK